MSVVKAGGLTQDRDAYRGSLRAARVEGRLLSQTALEATHGVRRSGKVKTLHSIVIDNSNKTCGRHFVTSYNKNICLKNKKSNTINQDLQVAKSYTMKCNYLLNKSRYQSSECVRPRAVCYLRHIVKTIHHPPSPHRGSRFSSK